MANLKLNDRDFCALCGESRLRHGPKGQWRGRWQAHQKLLAKRIAKQRR